MVLHILPLGSLSAEWPMKHQWQVRRWTAQCLDAQGRWDRAYQCLLRWTLEAEGASPPLRARTVRRSTMRVAVYVWVQRTELASVVGSVEDFCE
jgi:hypothetical protein